MEESNKLREVPPLSEILGLVEGQLIMALEKENYEYVMRKHTIIELYDNYLVISRYPIGKANPSSITIDMRDVESLIKQKKLVPLMKNHKPAMARRIGLFKKRWAVDY